jgi:hypothetical protein
MSEDSEVAEQLVPLARETSFELIADLLELLEKQGVPYEIQEVTAPEPWEGRVWVPASHELLAREMFEELTNERRAERDMQAMRRYVEMTSSR